MFYNTVYFNNLDVIIISIFAILTILLLREIYDRNNNQNKSNEKLTEYYGLKNQCYIECAENNNKTSRQQGEIRKYLDKIGKQRDLNTADILSLSQEIENLRDDNIGESTDASARDIEINRLNSIINEKIMEGERLKAKEHEYLDKLSLLIFEGNELQFKLHDKLTPLDAEIYKLQK